MILIRSPEFGHATGAELSQAHRLCSDGAEAHCVRVPQGAAISMSRRT